MKRIMEKSRECVHKRESKGRKDESFPENRKLPSYVPSSSNILTYKTINKSLQRPWEKQAPHRQKESEYMESCLIQILVLF